jgi:hypothetical protein
MTSPGHFAMINRLSRFQPDDLDPLLAPFDKRADAQGSDIAPCPVPGRLPRPALSRPDAIAVGVLVDRPITDPADVALRLAALALEQDVEVIALSSLDYSGLERFGFRSERIAGHTAAERAACRDQIMQFWGIEVLLPT